MSFRAKRRARGFTMIELIVVIIILGILAAVALPRFTNLQRDARVAKLNAVRGSVQSAMAMVNGAAIARQGQAQPPCNGGPAAAINATTGNGTICTPQGRVNVVMLFPQAANRGITAAAGLDTDPAKLTADGYQTATVAGALQFRVTGGANPIRCSFNYTPPAALGQSPTLSVNDTNGC